MGQESLVRRLALRHRRSCGGVRGNDGPWDACGPRCPGPPDRAIGQCLGESADAWDGKLGRQGENHRVFLELHTPEAT